MEKVVTHLLMTSRTITTTFSIKIKSYFEFFSGLKTVFGKDRYLFGVLTTCENVCENFEEI